MSAIDDYLAKVSPLQKAELERIRRIVREVATLEYPIPDPLVKEIVLNRVAEISKS